ncbi:MAG: glycosyl hydrolase [Candidatus Saccharibacteria bacterium]|jgi:hypothetical protein|nr:glycosyl hydrolase [Candidatus Saccharibacteria bacterium]
MVAKKQAAKLSMRRVAKKAIPLRKSTGVKQKTFIKRWPLNTFSSLHKKIIGIAILLIVAATIVINVVHEPSSYAATQTYIAVETAGGKCLDNRSAKAASGNQIIIYKCNGTVAQKVSFFDDQTIRIQGYCLDLKGATLTSRTEIHLYACKGYASQKWSVKSDGSIVNVKSGRCLDVRGGNTADRTPVQIYTCNQTAAQEWRKINTATPATKIPAPIEETAAPSPSPTPAPERQSTPPRNSDEYGNYQPSPSTTGYDASTTLTAYNAETTDSFTLSRGGVIENKIIYGDMKYTGSEDLLIKNSLLVGGRHKPANITAIVDLNATRKGVVTIQDSIIRARVPRDNRDGITGYKFRAYRNEVTKTVDGFGVFVVPGRASTIIADVIIAGNYVHDLAYTYTGHSAHDDGTHNDGLQIQGGRNIRVTGNYFSMTSSVTSGGGINPDKPWLIQTNNANGVGLLVQDNTGAGIDSSVIVEKNYFARGLALVSIKSKTFILRDNKFYRATALKPGGGWSGYWIRLDNRSGTAIHGFNVGEQTNRWIDGPYAGKLMAEPRDRGIHYNN